MATTTIAKLVEAGLQAGEVDMYDEDKIWSGYSGDKIDIGQVLSGVIRTLGKTLPLGRKLRALSIGSGSEPQLLILEGACQGGLYLLDIDRDPLGMVRARCQREGISQVHTIRADYNRALGDKNSAETFPGKHLGDRPVELITLHHSLYYSSEQEWQPLFAHLRSSILARTGAIHAVLMSSRCREPASTTWLFSHFAGKFMGAQNDQDLLALARALKHSRPYNRDQVLTQTHQVCFMPPTFGEFMSVIWMILLYPNVYKYSQPQREEITEYMLKNFWRKKRPLLQAQDHMVIYRGIPFRGKV